MLEFKGQKTLTKQCIEKDSTPKFRGKASRKGLKMKKTLLFLILAAFFVASVAEAAPARNTGGGGL